MEMGFDLVSPAVHVPRPGAGIGVGAEVLGSGGHVDFHFADKGGLEMMEAHYVIFYVKPGECLEGTIYYKVSDK